MKNLSLFQGVIGVFLFATLMAAAPSALAQDFHNQPLIIETEAGAVEFQIEIAADEATRSRGLMFRRSLTPDSGMLFVYAAPREIQMWMKNTYISLDMIFIDKVGKIINIAKKTTPQSLKVVSSYAPAQYVLEVEAGVAKAKGLRVGQQVSHPMIGN